MSSGDILSDSSSSSASEFRYPHSGHLMSSPLKAAAIFSDEISSGGSMSSSDRRKRTHYNSFQHPSSSMSRKRFRSSPTAGRSLNASWKGNHQLTQSSPIKPRKAHFTTSSGPNLSFFEGSSTMADDIHTMNFAAASDDEENTLPAHSFQVQSSPPRTPPPFRSRSSLGRRSREKNGKSGEEGADLLLYLATSPSPAKPSRTRMQPPSTPPARNNLPSSMMVTPGGGGILSGFGAPNTPSQGFDFSDFVHTTPSPFQPPRGRVRTPATIKRRGLTFENFIPPGSSPTLRTAAEKVASAGLRMQLGGSLDR